MFKKIKYKNLFNLLLIILQVYFSAIVINNYSFNNSFNANEYHFISGNFVCSLEANLNKISASDKRTESHKLLSEKSYSVILSEAEELRLLFFINSEKNPHYLLSVIPEKKSSRSPPFL